jgi:hypothetical protein
MITDIEVYRSMCLDELAAEIIGGRIVRRGDKYALHVEFPSVEGALDLDAIDALEFVSRDEMRKSLTEQLLQR